MSDFGPIDDEWLRDVKGLAYRDQDGPQVSVSRGGMKRLIARLEAVESQLAAAQAARSAQSDPKVEELDDSEPEAPQEAQVLSMVLEARTKKLKVEAVYNGMPYGDIPAHAPPICIDGQIPMRLMSYENRLATYVCEHCRKTVVVGEGRT
jgi:hypothetical protein